VTDSQIDTIAKIAEKISAEDNRRTRQAQTIENLLNKRQGVLVSMCELAELKSTNVYSIDVVDGLKSFCQALVDYTAHGHFEIYERIIDGKERRGNIQRVADRVYPSISSTTEQFVEFNDKYDGAEDNTESLVSLYNDLSTIGEGMAERIESEDMLLREISDQLESPSKFL
jgi:regulator of sigma D